LKGVITFNSEALYSRFLQDETAGIYLLETNLPPLRAGQRIAVEGVTRPGEYAPVVEANSVNVLGDGTFPAPRRVTAQDLVSGSQDSQFVELEGLVRAVQFEEETESYLVDLVAGGERFTAYAAELPAGNPSDLVDSTVIVRGVCSSLFNRSRQLFGFRLLVPRAGDLIVKQAAPEKPFEIAAQPMDSLLRFTPRTRVGHRVKVVGTVTLHEPGRAVFIQDGATGLQVLTRQRTALAPGDKVEVLGFPAKGEYTPVLEDAIYRKIDAGTAPEATEVTVDEALSGVHDCRLVSLRANLVERTRRGPEQFVVLESGGFTFNAHLPLGADGSRLAELKNGSDVQVEGICLIERGSGWQAGSGWRAKSFRLLLPGTAAIHVLAEPPWWTQEEKVRVVGVIGILVLALLVLIDVLRRRPKPAA